MSRTVDVHIDTIRPGDTIIHHGSLKTVCPSNLNKGGFMGTSIFGDSYSCGKQLVKKALIEHKDGGYHEENA